MSEAGRRGAREKLREAACNAVAGGLAGVISATVLCPLDVIKTRLQVYGLPSNFSGAPPPGRVIISGFQQILKNEGLPGLYRGLSPTIVALFPTWAKLATETCCISPLEVTAELFLASRSEDEADCRSEQEWRMKFLFVSLWAKN
ncbi:unnamed protein product [Miscanthus lutarioriparius]|uniref:Uncharacterized protein n=1 Tax=Miscanthus lutarioriparius TaxID=422564 RepID=A0A811NUP3_9POAL|nr:unnamed protein product [Miscanthus lutarioriparius]